MHHPGSKVDVIIPALNEVNGVCEVIGDLPESLIRNIIVCDNGSTDGTPEKAKSCGAVVVHEERKGYGSACLKAIDYIETQGSDNLPEILVFIDSDYSDDPTQLGELLQPIFDRKADLVIGSRVKGKKEAGALTPQQKWGNALATTLIYWLFGKKFTDLGPFRAIRYSTFKQLNMKDPNYGWTVEMQIKAALHEISTVEIPVRYKKRIGKSKVSGTLKGVLMAGYKILGLIFLYGILRK